MSKQKIIISQIVIFLIGAIGYPCIELLYRAGNTHWTMALVGGIALMAILDCNYILKEKNILLRVFTATTFVVLIELVAGLFINKIFKMKVWDYSNCDFNLCGQICLKFSVYWFLLCFAIILLFEGIMFLKRHLKIKKINSTFIKRLDVKNKV